MKTTLKVFFTQCLCQVLHFLNFVKTGYKARYKAKVCHLIVSVPDRNNPSVDHFQISRKILEVIRTGVVWVWD